MSGPLSEPVHHIGGERSTPSDTGRGQPDLSAYADLPDGVVVADSSGSVIAVNPVTTSLLGRPQEELLGADFRSVLPLHDIADRDWWDCLEPYGGLLTRTRMPERLLVLATGPRAGHQLHVAARMVRGPDHRLQRLVVTLRDAAARERQERQQADLVSTTAHELRSPLTSIKGFTATLLAKWSRFNDEQKLLMLETVNADADRVTRLISELLDVSRIEAGRLELRKRPVDLWELVEQVVISQVAAGQPLDRFNMSKQGPLPEIWADLDKLLQVLGNLVENAVRHGAGRISISLTPDGPPGGPPGDPVGAAIEVADEGGGIPETIRGQIFGRFARGPMRGSTGLGLFIVRGIVQAHGGEISAGRGPDGGAVFRFTVPTGTPSFL